MLKSNVFKLGLSGCQEYVRGNSDQESNVDREGFIKCLLVDGYSMSAALWYLAAFDQRPNLISDLD